VEWPIRSHEVHNCSDRDNHQHCINNVYAARDTAVKLFDLLLKPEGTAKDVPFKRRKVKEGGRI